MMILFDFDGTLADSIGLGFDLVNSYAEEFGYIQVPRERGRELSALQIMKEAHISFRKLPYLVFFFRKKLTENSSKIKMIPGADQLLSKLKAQGYTLGILTSHSAEGVDVFLKKYNLESYFSYIKTEVPLFGKKAALRKARKELKTSFVYVGDELRDVEACRKTKVPIVSLPWGFNSYEVLEPKNPGLVAKDTDEAFTLICAEAEKIQS